MSRDTQSEIRTLAYVLRRTNYGEADRILNLITPKGKITAIAKGVRKEKSKLAGSVEMFSLIDINIHQGKSEFGIVTNAKMLTYYDVVLKDLEKMEFAALVLKKINLAAESSDNPEFFDIVDAVLKALKIGVANYVIETWFWLNYAKALGEQVNVYRDVEGKELSEFCRYSWDKIEMAMVERENGEIDADAIKIIRLMLNNDLTIISRIKNLDEKILPILRIAKAINKV